LDLRAGEHACGFARNRHPDPRVDLRAGVLSLRSRHHPLVAQRAGCVENIEDERASDFCSLHGGVHEDHRDMQKRRIELAPLTVIEPAKARSRSRKASSSR